LGLVVKELLKGTKRFSELNRAIPCTQKVLTSNLRELEKDKIISRKVYAVVPPKVEYSLTEIGKTIEPIINLMNKWGAYYRNL
jgi:DNA-binding HxlR family transcriptional regulator